MIGSRFGAEGGAEPGEAHLDRVDRQCLLRRSCTARRKSMPGIPGNPLGYARDIAEGSAPFSVLQLKKMTPDELKKMFSNINIVLREVRTTAVIERDIDGMRRRAHKLQRLSNALLLLETHAKKLRVTL
jgi:hypothetical protein